MKSVMKKFLVMLILFVLLIPNIVIESQGAYEFEFIASPGAPDTDTKIRLDWASVPGASVYQLFRDDGSGDVEIAQINVNQVMYPLTYTDSGLQPLTTYTYTIKAYANEDLTGLLAEETVVFSTTAMIKPYDLQAVYNVNSRIISLKWKCSGLATGSVVRVDAVDHVISETTSFDHKITDLQPVHISVKSTGAGTMESEFSYPPIVVIPIEQPIIWVSSSGGTASISWSGFSHINLFQLERAKWNGTSWGSWQIINTDLSGSGTTDTPAEGGLYRYRLSAKPNSGYAGFSNITDTASGLPAPYDLTLTVVSPGEIELNWENGPGNTADIQVLRLFSDGTFKEIAMLPYTEVSYSDLITVTPGSTYTYRVRAYESGSSTSEAAEASITPSLPNKPTSLFANVVSASAIRLDWTDNSDNESGFKIERLTDAGVFTEIDTTGPNVTTYTDGTVTAGHMYIYRIRAYNGLGNSDYSNEATINSWDAVPPASLDVIAVSPTRIDLVWSYSGTENYNTVIERKTGTDGEWRAIYTTAIGAVRYSDTGLTPNTRYFYRVRKSLGPGSFGVPYPNNDIGIGAYTLLNTLRLYGEASSGNTIYLHWSGNTSNADVIIERKMPNGSFSALTTVGPSTIGWYDNTGLVPGASYTYRVKARTSTNESLYSNELTVKNLYLEAPSGLSATVGTDSSVTLNWTDNSTDESGFEIWRYDEGTDTGTYTLYATVEKNVVTFTDNMVHTGVKYSYMVRAYVADGSLYSQFSGTASVGVGLINPPANLHYDYVSSTRVLLRWTDTSDNESGFIVERKVGENGEWSGYSWLSANTTAYDVTNLNPYTKYYFRVRAYTTTGNADAVSEEILVSTALPAAPSDVVASSLSPTQVKITWKDNSDSEDGFKILRKPANGYYFTPLAVIKKDTEIYLDNNVQPGMRYEYKIAAYNAVGSSESKAVEVRTGTKAYFSDLGSVSWAKDAIENFAGLGIIKGVTKTQFKPNNTITRAEFIAIVVRAFGFETVPIGSMADVRPDKWYYKDIMVAENLGLISGDDKNRFYPEVPITREEIAVILFKSLVASGKDFKMHDNTVLEKFKDRNDISPHAISSMAALVGEGIIEGYSGNIIGPKHMATRAQAAVFLYRLLNSLNR
ncbi:MAG: fibronectin type III domain-containing protein [Bacillota bacterium]